MSSTPPNVSILILEDNEIDREIALRSFKKADIQNPVFFAADGIEALDLLKDTDETKKIQQPCLIITDLNLPRMDGLSFIENIKEDENLKKNIAYILSTSNRPADIAKSYALNISGYFLKDNIKEFAGFLKSYLDLCKFPTKAVN